MTALDELQRWYESNCNELWEHQYGVKIETLDNPGWALTVDLVGTPLESAEFSKISVLEPEREWFICSRDARSFNARGGPNQLSKLVEVFLLWASEFAPNPDKAGMTLEHRSK